MGSVTVDQVRIKDHTRWAKDQKSVDASLISNTPLVAAYLEATGEATGLSALYYAQFDQLFELQKRNAPWATFQPPPRPALSSKRFFSHKLLSQPLLQKAQAKTLSKLQPQAHEKKQQDALLEELAAFEGGELIISDDSVWRKPLRAPSSTPNQDDTNQDNPDKEDETPFWQLGEGEEPPLLEHFSEKISQLKKMPHQTQFLFEKEKIALFNLLESIEWINSLLKQIHSKKAQYQKG